MFKVKFVVHAKTKKNQQTIKIVGNLPLLGNWNPAQGLAMEQYYEGQWESLKHVQILNGHQFEFKIVKISANGSVEWQQLPNNSNRKFKPKFHTKLILTWSSNIGQALNQAKSSLKLRGFPGVMVKGYKQAGMLKRIPFKSKKSTLCDDTDSQNENDNDSFCGVINRKRSSDIRQSINSGDIEQIYYDTTQLENAYNHYKKIQVNLVCNSLQQKPELTEKIQQQLKDLLQLQNIHFKWLLLNDQTSSNKFKRLSFRKIQKFSNQKIQLQQYSYTNVQKNHFVFLDLDLALKTQVGLVSACLYLSSNQFQKAKQNLKNLQKFRFICFDTQQANKKLHHLVELQKNQAEGTELQKYKMLLLSENQKIEKQSQNVTLAKIVQQLQYCDQSQTSINTVHTFTKYETLANVLNPNTILIIDSQLLKTDKKFFEHLLDAECQKRLIIIIHNNGIPEWIHNFDMNKNVCIILDNFTKLYFVGKMYDPSKKHRQAIQFIIMRAKLFAEQNGGKWTMNQNSFVFHFKNVSQSVIDSIKKPVQKAVMDLNYFKFSQKQNRIKVIWNLSHPVRLLRTLIRIKTMEEGQIGNIYLITQNQNFDQLKQQLRLLINVNPHFFVNGKNTKITDFGYGDKNHATYNIKAEGMNTTNSTNSTSSSLSQNARKSGAPMNSSSSIQSQAKEVTA